MATFAEHLDPDQRDALRELAGDEIDPASMTVEELREEIEARAELIREINATIDDNDLNHRRMDQDYRAKLFADREQAIDEHQVLHRVLGRKLHLDRMRAQQEAKAARNAANSGSELQRDERNTEATKLFVKAAFRMIDREQFHAIWKKARELWPDAECWAEPSVAKQTEHPIWKIGDDPATLPERPA